MVFRSGPERFEEGCEEKYTKMKEHCLAFGFHPICPLDDAPGLRRTQSDDPIVNAANTFAHNQQHVRNCDIIMANLNDFHGWEPESDTSFFECDMSYQLGKKLSGYMRDTRIMKERVPHLGGFDCRDACGCNVI